MDARGPPGSPGLGVDTLQLKLAIYDALVEAEEGEEGESVDRCWSQYWEVTFCLKSPPPASTMRMDRTNLKSQRPGDTGPMPVDSLRLTRGTADLLPFRPGSCCGWQALRCFMRGDLSKAELDYAV